MVEVCKLTHGKENLMGQQVPAPWGKILRLGFYFTALPEGWESGRKTRKKKKHFWKKRALVMISLLYPLSNVTSLLDQIC